MGDNPVNGDFFASTDEAVNVMKLSPNLIRNIDEENWRDIQSTESLDAFIG